MRHGLVCAALLSLIASIVEAGDRHEPPRYRIEKLQGVEGFPTEMPAKAIATSVYVRHGGKWLCANYQETALK